MTNIEFVVAQTGSLCHEDHQHGEFDYAAAVELVDIANAAGVKLKEHNADYLTPAEVQLRKSAGVHALNIAPQLGVVQTKLLRAIAAEHAPIEWKAFARVVLASGRWTKWTDLNSELQKINVAGHYCFASTEYQALTAKLVAAGVNWPAEVSGAIRSVLDTYTQNL
jgi:hypothetical protein